MIGLQFRAGRVDETLATSGWLSVLLHAATAGIGPHVETVVLVGPAVSGVLFCGQMDETCSALASVAHRLSTLDHDEISAQILALRENGGSADGLTESWFWRYGVRGLGAEVKQKFGLWNARPERLSRFAESVFTLDNAVVVTDRFVPQLPDLPLPVGEFRPVPTVAATIEAPAWYPRTTAGVALSGIVPRSFSAILTSQIVRDRLSRRLRDNTPVSYSPSTEYVPVVTEAHISCSVDCRPGNEPECLDAVLNVLTELAGGGLTEATLNEYRRANAAQIRDEPEQPPWSAGQDALLGRPLVTVRGLLAEIDSVTLESIARDATSWLATGLIGIPETAGSPDGVPSLLVAPDDPPLMDGWVHEPLHPSDSPEDDPWLIRHAGLLQVVSARGAARRTLDLSTSAGVAATPDGQRIVFTPEGEAFTFEPAFWSGGGELVATIDSYTPQDRIALLPARPLAETPTPLWQAKSAGLRQTLRKIDTALLATALACFFGLRLAARSTVPHAVSIALMIIGFAGVAGLIVARLVLGRRYKEAARTPDPPARPIRPEDSEVPRPAEPPE
jgi:hypothetical protein